MELNLSSKRLLIILLSITLALVLAHTMGQLSRL